MVMASGADLESMNSLVTTHPLAKQVQRYVLLTTLVRYDSALAVMPYLARRWTWSGKGTTLHMVLHSDLRWHDGQPTTAHDAAWTLETALDSSTGYPRRSDLANVTGAEAVDDSTLVIHFAQAPGRIPDVLTDLAILPAHLLNTVIPAEMRRAGWNARPIGNGPFRFVQHEANRRWVFARNPEFPVSMGGPPRLERLAIAIVDEPTTKLAALTSGELDFAGIQPAHAAFVRQDPRLAVLDYPLWYSYVMVFNTRRPPFDRVEARRAIGFAIDRLEIVSGYLFGFATPASGPIPPRPGSGPPPVPTFAPGRGRALLGSKPLSFELVTVGSGEAAMEQMIQQQLARIEVSVSIRQLELATFLDRVRSGKDFDAAILGISGDVELGHLRQLLDLSGLQSKASGRELLAVFADRMPVTFLYHARGVQGANRRVENVAMDLRGELATVARWSVR